MRALGYETGSVIHSILEDSPTARVPTRKTPIGWTGRILYERTNGLFADSQPLDLPFVGSVYLLPEINK
jgi:hypothetical protein